jgi:hypothetical protein
MTLISRWLDRLLPSQEALAAERRNILYGIPVK